MMRVKSSSMDVEVLEEKVGELMLRVLLVVVVVIIMVVVKRGLLLLLESFLTWVVAAIMNLLQQTYRHHHHHHHHTNNNNNNNTTTTPPLPPLPPPPHPLHPHLITHLTTRLHCSRPRASRRLPRTSCMSIKSAETLLWRWPVLLRRFANMSP